MSLLYAGVSKAVRRCLAGAAMLLALCAPVRADVTYLAPEAFLKECFGDAVPKPQLLWLDEHAQTQLKAALGHAYPQARLRYWRAGTRTAWVLDETGKEYPITAGYVVEHAGSVHRIDRARLLIYRESRGDEVRYPAFLKQFVGARIGDDAQLDRGIDGISGATLSVSAMKRMAQAALMLDALADAPGAP